MTDVVGEEIKRAVVSTTHNVFGNFGVVCDGAQGAVGLQSLLRNVGISEVPDVGVLGHQGAVLGLELKLSVRNRHTALVRIWMPVNLGHRSPHGLRRARVLKDHDGLSRDVLLLDLWVFALEVLFKHVDLVVRSDRLCRSSCQISCCLGIP